ncbi:peptidase T [candidate division KSB1 bacterium]|nr:MAG: peptidase T [candidate division KSB1 bacterium]
MKERMLERFLRYVKIDTQSSETAGDAYPSTEKQKNLLKLLVDELKELGLTDVSMDEYGYVFGTLPANVSEDIKTIGFISHVDTSPEVSGENVKPQIHKNYQGEDIVLPGDKTQVIKFDENPHLKEHIGHSIITSDGTTLLGADDKAGIAEIMTMLEYFSTNPDVKHGTIKVGFTPDEEIGEGTKYFNVEKFGADFAYTVDGESPGEVEDETFNASLAEFEIKGVNVHPGYAKDKMVNSIRIIGDIIHEINSYPAPETTEKKEGFLHPYVLSGSVDESHLKVLIRDFELKGIEEKSKVLNDIRNKTADKYPGAEINLTIKEQYKNMKIKLDEEPRVIEYAEKAVKMAGLEPQRHAIRGGTDGAKLCFMGLLTPNIFTGGHNFHSRLEWIALEDMEKAVEVLINLVKIWAEEK